MSFVSRSLHAPLKLWSFKVQWWFYPVFSTLKDHNLVPWQKLKNLRQPFVAMNMMNKCTKFQKDSPSSLKVKFNPLSAIEHSEMADFVYNFVKKPYASEQLRWHIWPTFPLNFFMKFSQMPLYFVYTMVQKNDQKLKLRGSCLKSYIDDTRPLFRAAAFNTTLRYVIVHTILPPNPVILWREPDGKPTWLPLNFGYHDVMCTLPSFWLAQLPPGHQIVLIGRSETNQTYISFLFDTWTQP